jgi:hypothetical protein
MANENEVEKLLVPQERVQLEIEQCIEDCFDREFFFNKHCSIGEHWLNGRRIKLLQNNLL